MINYRPYSHSSSGEHIFSTIFTNEERKQRIQEKVSEFDERIHKKTKLRKFRISHEFVFFIQDVEATNEEEAIHQYWQTIKDIIWFNMPDNFKEVKPKVEELP
jgi:hypothetical protein